MNNNDENQQNKIDQNINDISISKEMETSFIDYAMSVIVSRAIPDARDGLKPVHRRILYAMDQMEMTHTKSFKKSAHAVGTVIAKYHPHGDSAVYESLVRMAQPFSLRYPLVWGQGNFGSIDGDSAAAMRYTEAKLQKISSLMLEDIKKNTVDFQNNYDDSEIEPKVLPGKIPNLLLNGTTGIAVGMATSIPPHNINEILTATIKLIENRELSNVDLLEYVKGPDFPTGGIIINESEMLNSYLTGRGRAIIRSKTNIEFDENKNSGRIIITEIPYMVNKSQMILKIADLVKNKVIESISDIRDESNRKGIRVVIQLKKGFIPEVELNKLFKLTQLQSTFSINMLSLVNERPKILNLKDSLEIYINHQIDVLVRKTKYSLEKAEARKHILEGLAIALDHIDEVISIIRNSKETKEAQDKLIQRFNLSELQSKAILEMRLQRLTGLERENLLEEINVLLAQIEDYNDIINSTQRQDKEIISLLNYIIDTFGDERRTEVANIGNINNEDLIPKEDVIITITNNGYIKRLPINEYKAQNRGGQGFRAASTNDDDYIIELIASNTHTDLLFFTTFGKVYKIRAHQIPQFSKNAKGLPIINIIDMDKKEKIKSVINLDEYDNVDLFFVTENGISKKTCASEFERVNKNGKRAITLKEDDMLLGVNIIPKEEKVEIILGNSNGKAIRFNSEDIRTMGRTAAGVKGMNIDDGKVVDYASSNKGELILSISENGFGKMTNIDSYRITKRGGKGVKTIDVNKAGKLVALKAVTGMEDLLIITDKGTFIRTSLEQVSETNSRAAKGVTIVKLKNNEKIASVAIVPAEKEIEELTKEIILEE